MRDKIVKKASELFTKKGVDKTSLAEIASGVGISKGTLYYHFSTKNDLIFSVTELHMEELTNRMLDLLKANNSPENIVVQFYSTMPKAVTRSRLHIYLLREAVTDSPQLMKRFQSTYKSWKELLKDSLLKIYPRSEDIDAIVSFIIASIDGLIIQNLLNVDDISPGRYAKLIEPFLNDG